MVALINVGWVESYSIEVVVCILVRSRINFKWGGGRMKNIH